MLVSSPKLFEAECRTPRQIQQVSAFCRYLELSDTITAQANGDRTHSTLTSRHELRPFSRQPTPESPVSVTSAPCTMPSGLHLVDERDHSPRSKCWRD